MMLYNQIYLILSTNKYSVLSIFGVISTNFGICGHLALSCCGHGGNGEFALVDGDGGGGHWLVWMEWRPSGWSVCLPLLIFPCTIKSRSSLLAPAHPGGPKKGP